MVLVHSIALLWLGAQGITHAHAHSHHGYAHLHHHAHHHDHRDNSATINVLEEKPPLPLGSPHPPPAYMKDNVHNYFGSAPDRGSLTGPVLGPLNATMELALHGTIHARDNGDNYWLSSLGSHGQSPFAQSGYQFFRNVKDFGAVGDGVTDDTAAINRAVTAFSSSDHTNSRCGKDCGSTSTGGAVVYFPAGTYVISTPIIQYYYTQFIGNPSQKPTIKGSKNFTGIALVDSDFYIPGGNGDEWYINQSNFYRQIRNFVFDMTSMNWTNTDNNQTYVPAGIHWQVGQATSITNCDFKMAVSTADQSATAVGIYMENGSGGMVADLTFTGGNIGFLAGSQQFTAINLKFTSCLTAIKSIWNWGFTWKNIYVLSCYIAIDATEYSGLGKQGTGSIAVVDSHFDGVPYAITVAKQDNEQPSILLDNLLVENSASVVLISGGDTILEGSTGALYFDSWVSGYRYLPDGSGGRSSGFMSQKPDKPSSLLDGSGAYFRRAKPQYESETPVVATDHGVSNDGTGDQSAAINSLLSGNVGSVIFFPAGVYVVESTVKIPVGSKIIGSGWSQIMGTGSTFEDVENPTVVVQVGDKGDQGVIEITDMLFTVKGATAGAVLMEWNVHESTQGSAAMWDTHFRVGGANGTHLGLEECPTKAGVNKKCMAAHLLMHVTSLASGYFENVWAWVADHDLDSPLNSEAFESDAGIPLNVQTDISVYVGRGILIESQGPTWLYGTSSEHAQMYQYQLVNAANIYMGHMQTETPYYQPSPNALSPYIAGTFSGDPTYLDCDDDLCKGAWALRVINSSDVFVYSAGFYSFFQDYDEGCIDTEDCQQSLIETNFANRLYMYNIFTKGNVEIVSPRGSLAPLLFNDTTRNGFTSEIAAWLALSTGGEDIGSSSNDSGTVFLDPLIWGGPIDGTNVSCHPPCTYVIPPTVLPTPTTFVYPPLPTTVGVGYPISTSYVYLGKTITTTSWFTTSTTTTISIPEVVGTTISFWNVPIGPSVTSSVITPSPSVIQTAFNITWPSFTQNTKTFPATVVPFYPPPWPGSSVNPSLTPTGSSPTTSERGDATKTTTGGSHATSGSGGDDDDDGSHNDHHHRHPITHHIGPAKPKCTSNPKLCGVSCNEGIGGLLNRVFHVCHPCWQGCGGSDSPNNFPNDPNSPDPGTPDDPNNPSGPSSTSSQCSTATYSSCNTACVTAASTSSCTSTCKDIVGCDTTGTSTLGTYTLAPIMTGVPEPWYDYADNEPTDAAGDWAAGASIYRSLGEAADPTSGVSKTTMTTTQQPTTTKAPPTPSPTSVFAVFAQEIQAVAHGGGGSQIAWAWQGMLLPYPKWYEEACNFKEYRVVDGGFFSKGQKYPSSLGTFSLGSYKNCKYTGSKDSVGEVNCDGGVTLSCTGIDKSHATPNSPSVDCEKVDDPEVGIAKNQLYLQLYCPVV
ncbi:pectate lyase superfamily protein-domain-containing protein [Aspergillus pseudonomiae]|uniref:Pectate lyase superfamily protein-domain-containing protein n=1 Tax=Aspergillus pseudonomiae TaxID=1506151 RepID=A0A5N7CZT0_9EURO|nr:pectate lyase superfamily protein-domain-containing protein [Aspergillus pseudonomiae]KAE8399665.1 pectate lyase superfamily protein-domain-containing protein [Aspergillus pseudonomiae]